MIWLNKCYLILKRNNFLVFLSFFSYDNSISTNDEKPEDKEYDEDDEHDDEDDDDYGTVENQLVNKITEEGGIRAVPSKESLEQFTQRY